MTHEEASRRFYAHVWPHRAMVLRTARFLTRDLTEADDLAQETLVKAFKAIAQFDESTNAAAWLSTVLRNTWIDQLRARGRQVVVPLDPETELADPHPPQRALEGRDVAAMLDEFSDAAVIDALHQLPAEIRWTLLLVDVQQFDHAQAAEILQVPAGTVKSRAHRGRKMLRDQLLAPARPQSKRPAEFPAMEGP